MLLFLESIGTAELLLILVVALMVFGPRKLPELARSLGKGLNQFKRASDDFKQTWEREVEVESAEQRTNVERAMLPDAPTEHLPPAAAAADSTSPAFEPASTIARGAGIETASSAATTEAPDSTRKNEWL